MKKSIVMLSVVAALFSPIASHARDTTHYLDFHSVVKDAIRDGQLDGTVRFYLKGQATGKITRTFPEAVSNKRTNAANKSDEQACVIALRSALISFQENAKKHGANAVVDLVSFYKKNVYASTDKFECHAGAMMAAVTMKGRAAIVR